MSYVKYFVIAGCLVLSALPALAENHKSAQEVNAGPQQWNSEQVKLIELNRQVALSLKRDGFEAYSKLFHPNYSNWFMGVLPERPRAVFLADVKSWFDAGNYAIDSVVEPISVIIDGNAAYMRLKQTETFIDAKGVKSSFAFNSMNVMKKHQGRWTFYSTTFSQAVK